MPETLTVLGGGGWFPAHERQTACALLRNGSAAVMIDAGTGLGRLSEHPELLAGVERLDILLTHFHLDHIVGLAYIPAIGVCEETCVWGPGERLYGSPTAVMLERFTHEPYHPVPFEAQQIQVRDLPEGELELAGVRITHRVQPRHSAPTLGLRFGDVLAWITDTAYDPETAAFARGCALLAHECWWPSTRPRNPDIHSSATQAAQVARDAEAERLLLIHLPPFQESLRPLLVEAQATLPDTQLGVDHSELSMQPA